MSSTYLSTWTFVEISNMCFLGGFFNVIKEVICHLNMQPLAIYQQQLMSLALAS